jgi:hypothetical protein
MIEEFKAGNAFKADGILPSNLLCCFLCENISEMKQIHPAIKLAINTRAFYKAACPIDT